MPALYQSNPPGRQLTLTDEIKDRLIDASTKVVIQNQIAGMCGIHPSTLSSWMTKGEKHSKEGEDSIFAQLLYGIRKEQAVFASDCIMKLKGCPKNYGALTFLLEKCFREDFETITPSHRELLDFVENKIKPLLANGKDDHGQETEEIHPESN